jgi:hypothetical protein
MGGKLLAEKSDCKYLGSIPIDPSLTNCIEKGLNFLENLKDSASFNQSKLIINTLIN